MRIYSPLFLLAALGAMSAAASAAVDTSAWSCESCPYPKGASGTIDAGVGTVSDASGKFGDYTGLQKKGAYLVLGGNLSSRSDGGTFVDLSAADLGLDTRTLSARVGQEGLYTLRLGYIESPRHLSSGAQTPFAGNGGTVLTLPAGYPAAGTSTMPLASTLQAVDIGFKRQRLDLGGTLLLGEGWSVRVSLRRDARDGTQATAGSFFASTSQLVAPVDQETNQLEIAASYFSRSLQATVAYQLSQFKNGVQSLTWDNPFLPVVAGSTRGQLAAAPDNRLEQVTASAGYEVMPWMRASADVAVGRLTQDASYLAPTLTPGLAATVPTLPAQTLDGKVDTFDGSVRLTATPLDGLRMNASYARDVRDNRTASRSYPLVATDIFVYAQSRNNTPFSDTRDRLKLSADYRGPDSLKLSAGADQDNRQRTYTEVVDTRETTVWARVGMRPLEEVSLAFKLAHGQRDHSSYGTSTWFGSPENPLMRKYNLAARKRDTAGARAEFAIGEKATVGLSMDYAADQYDKSLVGLTAAHSLNGALDMSWALSEQTQLTAFAQGERIVSRQSGSERWAAPDWTAENFDRFNVLGLGIKHAAIADKLDIGAEASFSRSRSQIAVDTVIPAAQLPMAKTSMDSVKVYANYKLQDNLWLNASWWNEAYHTEDWRLDGVLPASVQNLLAFGQQPPHYRVDVVRVSLRYRF